MVNVDYFSNLGCGFHVCNQWVSHRNHRGNICGVDFIWLLNPNGYRKLLKTSWSEAVFGMFKVTTSSFVPVPVRSPPTLIAVSFEFQFMSMYAAYLSPTIIIIFLLYPLLNFQLGYIISSTLNINHLTAFLFFPDLCYFLDLKIEGT